MTAAQFNARYPVGTYVRYFPVKGRDDFEPTKTRTEAWTLADGTPVVSVVGFRGGVAIDHVEVDR